MNNPYIGQELNTIFVNISWRKRQNYRSKSHLRRSAWVKKLANEFSKISPMCSLVALLLKSISLILPLSCRFFNFCFPGTRNSSLFLNKTTVLLTLRARGRRDESWPDIFVTKVKSRLNWLPNYSSNTERVEYTAKEGIPGEMTRVTLHLFMGLVKCGIV